MLIIGIGDSAASLVGVSFGRHRWPRTRKTVEGSAAAVVAVLVCVAILAPPSPLDEWLKLASATVLACLVEAFTSQIDNLFLPLVYFVLLLLMAR